MRKDVKPEVEEKRRIETAVNCVTFAGLRAIIRLGSTGGLVSAVNFVDLLGTFLGCVRVKRERGGKGGKGKGGNGFHSKI